MEVRRPGMSLVELMVALGLFSILLATTLGFYRQQGKAFTEGNTRMTVMQNLRYGVNSIEQGLRTAGVGVPGPQPVLLYAGPDVVAFNGDYATNLANDFFAVYFDPRLGDSAVSALAPDRRITLPRTTFSYPATSYSTTGGSSPAETLIFFFAPDSTTSRSDDWALYRQTNDLAPETIARGLLRDGGDFFTYYTVSADGGGDGGSPVRAIPSADLPYAHTAAVHGSAADTGRAATVDSIRAVRVRYAATSGGPTGSESVRDISRLIRLPNAGVRRQQTCANPPLLGTPLLVTGVQPGGSQAGHIRLEWARATDEATGEQDVLRYVIWRRVGDTGPWGQPLVSVSPGSSSYAYEDYTAQADVEYSYALAAQDCTPQYSDRAVSGLVEWQAP